MTLPGANLAPLYDLLLSHRPLATAAHLTPDVVVHVGARLVSKRLASYLESSSVTTYLMVEEHGDRADPSHCVTHRLHGDVAALLAALAAGLGPAAAAPPMPPNPLLRLCAASRALERALEPALLAAAAAAEVAAAEGAAEGEGEAAAEAAACCLEVCVARHVCSLLTAAEVAAAGGEGGEGGEGGAAAERPERVLFVSNSLPIRHLDGACAHTPLVLSSRGASGIDGILHTAIGAAIGTPAGCTLLIGDLASMHDLNGLALLAQLKPSLVVVILNNSGGGIFRYLPIAQHADVYSPYFDTPHSLRFGQVCRGFGLPYELATDTAGFKRAYAAALAGRGPSVVEVITDKEENLRARDALCEAAAAAAQQMLSEMGEIEIAPEIAPRGD